KELIEVAAPGGGFILSSSNELGTETSVENALAMYRAGERYGVYEP
ncbi:MAG: uroporphyrinogen-III decarboxylase, partial [Thermoplasmata archaeon]